MGFAPLFGPHRQRNHDQPKALEPASSQPEPAAVKAPQRSGAEAPLHNERNVALLSHARGAASLNNSLKAFHRDASLLAALPKQACMQTLAQEPLYRWGQVLFKGHNTSAASRHVSIRRRPEAAAAWDQPAAGDRHSQHIICAYAALLQGSHSYATACLCHSVPLSWVDEAPVLTSQPFGHLLWLELLANP